MHPCHALTSVVFFFFSCFLPCIVGPLFCAAQDALTQNQSLQDGYTLISAGHIFELGFYDHRYAAIWYYNTSYQQPVWVASKAKPVGEDTGFLKIGNDGNLKVSGLDDEVVYWSTSISTNSSRGTSAKLLDSGNLILTDVDSGVILWQSFDDPSDTLLPGMKLGIHLRTNESKVLRSWDANQKPDTGIFTFGIDPGSLNQFLIWRRSDPYWRSIHWNGSEWEFVAVDGQSRFNFSIVSNEEEIYLTYSSPHVKSSAQRVSSWLVMNSFGILEYWEERDGRMFSPSASGRRDRCLTDNIPICRGYSSCNDDKRPLCECFPGFKPNAAVDWDAGNWSEGCGRTRLNCDKKNEFLPLQRLEIQYSSIAPEIFMTESEEKCKESCLEDCECNAYSHIGTKTNDEGITCQQWNLRFTSLRDNEDGQQIYVRYGPPELGGHRRQCPNCGNMIIPYPLSTGTQCGDPAYNSFHCNNVTNKLYFTGLYGRSYEVTRIDPAARTFIVQPDDASRVCRIGSGNGNMHLNRTGPFNITTSNNILFLNCSTFTLSLAPSWDCSLSSPCRKYIQEGPASCLNLKNCCSYDMRDAQHMSYSIDISNSGCSAYASIVDGANLSLPTSTWIEGVEIEWQAPQQPVCNSVEDCSAWSDSTCSTDKQDVGRKRCFCDAKFHWDPLTQNCTSDGGFPGTDGSIRMDKNKSHLLISLVAAAMVAFSLGLLILLLWIKFRRKGNKEKKLITLLSSFDSKELSVKDFTDAIYYVRELDIPFFDFRRVAAATSNFSDSNKLGQGGFGPVYKGKLQEGQDIAVKRLSKTSRQGLKEFMNELILIGKLQHRNLVRLLGYCVEGNEKMLLYEYMPNKSLDTCLFDPNQRHQLDWNKRFNITLGIARGLLYLHQDSRLPIIHRDLKTSNILLDEEMNPKISDFGMARIFCRNQSAENTKMVAGTYGYISPEYALHGHFSVKSDVFSFGVILLEIISGRRNSSFYDYENSFTLLGQAWRLWNEDTALEFMDQSLSRTGNEVKVLNSIHVGLLCVEENPADRPETHSVLSMLESENATLPAPKQPAFVIRRPSNSEISPVRPVILSINDVTISTMEGR